MLNYETQMLPFLARWQGYKEGTLEMLLNWPAQIYGVANFNLSGIEPKWCREKINEFDTKLSRLLYGKHWSQTDPLVRYQFLALSEHATFLHYNVLFNVLPENYPQSDARQSLIAQCEPERHESQCSVALPDELMTGRRIVLASEIAADLGD